MLIISLNINDFGGVNEQLANYRKINYYGRTITDWDFWRKIEKTIIIKKLKNIIREKQPTIFILQEFELNNSEEPMSFIDWMKDNGYKVKCAMPEYKISMTLLFVKNKKVTQIHISHSKTKIDARDCAIKIENYIIYGTHVPLNSKSRPTIREDYWDEIIDFYEEYKMNQIVLIGDFNTYNEASRAYAKYKKLLGKGALDLWLHQGKPNSTPTEVKYRNRLDYVFISPSVEENVVSMDIDANIMDKDKISDHAAVLLELK